MKAVNIDAIPAELRARPQWVCWKLELREGKLTKVPYNPRTGGKAVSTNAKTWGTLEQALARAERDATFHGIGYVFARDDAYVGIDLDNCIEEDRTLKPWALPLVTLLDGYAEVTPSGRGLHVIVQGTLPEESRHKVVHGDGHVEAYDWGRFFTMTGHAWGHPVAEIPGRVEQVKELAAAVLGRKEPERERKSAPPQPVSLDDRELLDRMERSRHGSEIRALIAGDTSSHGGDDSAADLALCNHLAWWTDRDAERMDRFFRGSGLFREKWERADYRESTIAKAIAATPEGYQPGVREEPAPLPGDEEAPPPRNTAACGVSRYETNAAVYEEDRAQRFAEKAERVALKNGAHPPPQTPALYSVADLRDRNLPEPTWAVEGFIPEGVTMLVAHSKIGKTFLAEDVAVAVALGGRAWGKVPVAQGKVIYLDTEGNQRRVQRRLRSLLGMQTEWPENLLMTHECVTLDAAGFRILETLLTSHPGLRLLVLDTLNAMRPGKGKINDLVKEDYDLIRSLRYLGERHTCAILLLHHCSLTKKDDSVNAGAGTHGLAAAASAVLTFKRTRGEHDAIMEITGNDITEEGKKHFKRDTRSGFWVLEGSGDEFMKTSARQEIFDQLALRGTLSPGQLAYALEKQGPEYEKLKKAMRRMALDGELICEEGKYSVPTVRN